MSGIGMKSDVSILAAIASGKRIPYQRLRSSKRRAARLHPQLLWVGLASVQVRHRSKRHSQPGNLTLQSLTADNQIVGFLAQKRFHETPLVKEWSRISDPVFGLSRPVGFDDL